MIHAQSGSPTIPSGNRASVGNKNGYELRCLLGFVRSIFGSESVLTPILDGIYSHERDLPYGKPQPRQLASALPAIRARGEQTVLKL